MPTRDHGGGSGTILQALHCLLSSNILLVPVIGHSQSEAKESIESFKMATSRSTMLGEEGWRMDPSRQMENSQITVKFTFLLKSTWHPSIAGNYKAILIGLT